MKATLAPVVIRTFRAVTHKLGRCRQQIPRTATEISVQKSRVPGKTKIVLPSVLSYYPLPWVEDPTLDDKDHLQGEWGITMYMNFI